MNRKSSSISGLAEYRIAIIALIALSFVVFFGKAYENLLRGIDSNIHAKIAMTVTSRPNLLPKLPIPDTNTSLTEPEVYFNDHPFFIFWVNGWIMRALGPSAWSARLLTACFSVGCILLTLGLGTLLHSRLFGFTSAIFLLCARDIVLTGATVSLDPIMMFFILLSFILWIKEKWIWLGLTVGVGLWIKTPVVLLIYPSAFLISWARGTLHENLKKIFQSFLLTLAVGSLIWLVTGLLGGWQLVQDYWIRQVWGTAVGGRHFSNRIDLWSAFRMLQHGFLPSLPFLGVGLVFIIRKTVRQIWKKKPWNYSAAIAAGVPVAVIIAAITPLKFRMDYYFNPMFPFLALLSSYSVVDLLKPIEKTFYQVFSSTVLLILTFLLCTPTELGPEAFVALKHWMPFIQTYGNCNDKILIVPGGEPIGSDLDYGLVLNFYTGHQVEVRECMTAGAAIRTKKPAWVILSQDHLTHCLSDQERSKYSTHLKVGSQYLLTSLIPNSPTIDLTPLEKELKPSIDCKGPSYPKDRYHFGF